MAPLTDMAPNATSISTQLGRHSQNGLSHCIGNLEATEAFFFVQAFLRAAVPSCGIETLCIDIHRAGQTGVVFGVCDPEINRFLDDGFQLWTAHGNDSCGMAGFFSQELSPRRQY